MTGGALDHAVPSALAARMNELVRATGKGDDNPATLLDAAIQGLENLVRQPESAHTALDLLAVDGLVTAAFAGAHDPSELDALAAGAAARLMALGDRPA